MTAKSIKEPFTCKNKLIDLHCCNMKLSLDELLNHIQNNRQKMRNKLIE